MAVKKIEEVSAAPTKVRGESFELEGKTHFVRVPKAKDMIELEKILAKEESQFGQGLKTVAFLCDSLEYEDLLDVYVPDLTVVFEVFDKILPANVAR